MSQSITLTATQWREVITPVLPCAGDDMMLPVLNTVHIRTHGKWLIATATDRFRVAMKRIAKIATDDDPTTEWPEFSALIPLKAVKSISAMLKPSRGGAHLSGATFAVEGDRLTVEASGLFDLFDAARFTHHLETGEFPKVDSLFAKALAVPDSERAPVSTLNPAFLSDMKACGSMVLRVIGPKADDIKSPIAFTDDDGFLALLMPRRTETAPESWEDVLAPKPEPAKPKPARKSRAKKAVA